MDPAAGGGGGAAAAAAAADAADDSPFTGLFHPQNAHCVPISPEHRHAAVLYGYQYSVTPNRRPGEMSIKTWVNPDLKSPGGVYADGQSFYRAYHGAQSRMPSVVNPALAARAAESRATRAALGTDEWYAGEPAPGHDIPGTRVDEDDIDGGTETETDHVGTRADVASDIGDSSASLQVPAMSTVLKGQESPLPGFRADCMVWYTEFPSAFLPSAESPPMKLCRVAVTRVIGAVSPDKGAETFEVCNVFVHGMPVASHEVREKENTGFAWTPLYTYTNARSVNRPDLDDADRVAVHGWGGMPPGDRRNYDDPYKFVGGALSYYAARFPQISGLGALARSRGNAGWVLPPLAGAAAAGGSRGRGGGGGAPKPGGGGLPAGNDPKKRKVENRMYTVRMQVLPDIMPLLYTHFEITHKNPLVILEKDDALKGSEWQAGIPAVGLWDDETSRWLIKAGEMKDLFQIMRVIVTGSKDH